MDRRTFMRRAGAGAAALGLPGAAAHAAPPPLAPFSKGRVEPLDPPDCVPGETAARDLEDLGIRRLSELHRLPWFDKDEAGALRLREGAGVAPVIDVHAHLGWSMGFGRRLDMTRRSDVQYFYDFKREQDVLYEQDHPTEDEAASITQEGLRSVLRTPERNLTHSAANLSAEMDRMRFQRIVLLPVELAGMAGRHASETLEAAALDQRFVPFGAVHPAPWGARKADTLQGQVDGHAIQGIKLHPVFQYVAPEGRDAMGLFEWCEANDVLVLSHAGYTGREPTAMRAMGEPERFAEALRLVLAHTGIRRVDETLAVARQFEDQVWVDISGQPASNMTYIFKRYSTEKILFGSDWPFFPLAVMLARTLVATEGCPEVRDNVLHHNARRLLDRA